MLSHRHATLPGVTLFDPEPEPTPDAPPETWTVSQLNEHLAAAIAAAAPGLIWVEGEITNLNRSQAGHVYFSLVEPGSDHREASSSLSVSLFRGAKERVNAQIRKAGGGLRIDDGVRVRIRGSIELYAKRGQVQMRMVAIDPEFTLGDLALRREALLRQLAEEGLLGANGLLAVPVIPLRVGLVTSVGSAAHADFLAEIGASGYAFDIMCVDARVQGVDAESTVIAALATLGSLDVDVIALVRGGGARTDLAAFDAESIARAVAGCRRPVWSGIGHETDRAVVDEVCHTSWKTPTACAAGLVDAVRAGRAGFDERWLGVVELAALRLERSQDRLDGRRRRVATVARGVVGRSDAELAAVRQRVRREARHRLESAEHRLTVAATTVGPAARRRLTAADHRAELASTRVGAADPARLLARGWSITSGPDGRPLRTAANLRPGDEIVTRLHNGSVRSTVSTTSPGPIGPTP